MTKGEIAKQYFLNGYNCAQAVALAFSQETGLDERTLERATVALAFSQETGLDERTLERATVALGGGLGRLRETCGAVSGGAVVLGLVFPERSKTEIYVLVQELAKRFREKNGSYNCGELLTGAGVHADASPNAEVRSPAYYKKRPCADLVADSADILADILAEQK